MLEDAPKCIFSTNSWSSGQKMTQRHFFPPTFHPLSLVIFATATVVAFVLLHNSRFNFHCYIQRQWSNAYTEIGPKVMLTSRDFLRERLQRAFTRANQLHSTAQYSQMPITPRSHERFQCHFLRKILQRAFTRANQLHSSAQYSQMPITARSHERSQRHFLREILQRAFTRANQLHSTAQYSQMPITCRSHERSQRHFLCERLQRAFTRANQLHSTAQYSQMPITPPCASVNSCPIRELRAPKNQVVAGEVRLKIVVCYYIQACTPGR